jgi:hypothetical protein
MNSTFYKNLYKFYVLSYFIHIITTIIILTKYISSDDPCLTIFKKCLIFSVIIYSLLVINNTLNYYNYAKNNKYAREATIILLIFIALLWITLVSIYNVTCRSDSPYMYYLLASYHVYYSLYCIVRMLIVVINVMYRNNNYISEDNIQDNSYTAI